MILYHASYIEIQKPNLSYSRKRIDFGVGFYTTPLLEQAKNWCKKFKNSDEMGIISVYDFDESKISKLNVLKFETHSEGWLDFIINCRKGSDTSTYDIVYGGIANDKVFDTIELFFDNLIDKKEAIKRLTYQKPNIQIAFRTEKALEFLTFIESIKVC